MTPLTDAVLGSFTSKAAIFILTVTMGLACRPRMPSSELRESWYETDRPEIFQAVDSRLYKFSDMSLQGSVRGGSFESGAFVLDENPKLWNGGYWPFSSGGMAKRWRDGGGLPSSEQSFDPANVSSWTFDVLSPIEKYDLIAGNFDFKATKAELAHLGGDLSRWAGWEGYCHGWSIAAILESAPTAPYDMPVKGHENLKIRLYPDDVKALLTKFYGDFIALTANGTGRRSLEIGMQCLLSTEDLKQELDPVTADFTRDPRTGRLNDLHCRDVNPGSFHVVLEAFMGLNRDELSRKAFVMDAASSNQVWNYPVVAYSSRQIIPPEFNAEETAAIGKLSAGKLKNNLGCKKRQELDRAAGMDRFRGRAGSGAACIVDMETTVYYLSLSTPADEVPTSRSVSNMTLSYSLELDDEGYITGGEWDPSKGSAESPDTLRPDVLWVPKVNYDTILLESAGGVIDFGVLQRIVNASP